MSIQNYIYLTIQFIACCTAVFYWRHYKMTPLWIFLPFLLYTFFNEITALLLSQKYTVRMLYNVYIFVSFIVYLYWFDTLLKLRFWKWMIFIAFCFIVIYDVFVIDVFKSLLKTALNAQAIFLLLFSLLFFVKLLKSNEVIHFQRLPEFWIVSGLLMFYIGFVPLSLYLGKGYNILGVYYVAIGILNFLMYSGFIIGFYVSGRR